MLEYGAGTVLDRPTPEALETAIRELGEDEPRRAELRRRSLQLVNERLTFKAYAENTSRLYASLLEQSRTRKGGP
jgi:glycosyltransferase involved in cell wall biosynthesis